MTRTTGDREPRPRDAAWTLLLMAASTVLALVAVPAALFIGAAGTLLACDVVYHLTH